MGAIVRVNRWAPLAVAAVALGLAWTPWQAEAPAGEFSRHMIAHMLLVAVAAPALALACAGTRVDPVRHWPRALSPVPASFVELITVWAWHTPALHLAARERLDVWVAEQGSFLGAGFLFWLAIVGGVPRVASASRLASGVIALVLTFAHMTLLGALFALTPRALFAHHPLSAALADQQIGGAIMLAASTAIYLPAALWLGFQLLRRGPSERVAA